MCINMKKKKHCCQSFSQTNLALCRRENKNLSRKFWYLWAIFIFLLKRILLCVAQFWTLFKHVLQGIKTAKLFSHLTYKIVLDFGKNDEPVGVWAHVLCLWGHTHNSQIQDSILTSPLYSYAKCKRVTIRSIHRHFRDAEIFDTRAAFVTYPGHIRRDLGDILKFS